jgi:hypothetical protein
MRDEDGLPVRPRIITLELTGDEAERLARIREIKEASRHRPLRGRDLDKALPETKLTRQPRRRYEKPSA